MPKGARRAGGLDEMIVSLYAGGMTVRDIQHHLARTLGTELSHDTISTITDAVLDEVKAWQTRPLEELYPILYLDALVIKVRDGHQVRNKAAHIAVGVDLDGIKHVLGIWVQATEGAKFWAGVCAELRNRGIRDVLIVCCDGLTGFPEAIEATWPHTIVQTCTVHLIRAAMRFVSYQDRKKVAAALRPIYTAPTVDAAESELLAFADSALGRRYPATVATWENAWERFIPFLAFPPELRRIIYTTNSIVIWSRSTGVRDVVTGPCGPGICLVDVVICRRPSRGVAGGAMHVQRVVTPAFAASSRGRCSVTTGCRSSRSSGTGVSDRHRAVAEHGQGVCPRSEGLVRVPRPAAGLDWREVRLEDVGEFVAWLRLPPAGAGRAVAVLPSVERHCGEATVNRKLSAVSAFYQHAARNGVDLGELLSTWQPAGGAGRRGGRSCTTSARRSRRRGGRSR